ncbi:transcription initiation factor TFIIF subunit beta [Spatholobus suberectus]|nr:transcription initiation factor TFIIF subunit beta [Spatholobus suberectus]
MVNPRNIGRRDNMWMVSEEGCTTIHDAHKCSAQSALSALPSSLAPSDPSRPVAKVVVSIDPLNSSDDDSPPQFTMQLAGTEAGHIPRCYVMDMSKDFIPMSVFSDTPQGKISMEGKILNKFDMRPHNQNLELYGKLCCERTNKYMVKSRQIQVINNDSGVHMRPMPGMISFSTSGPSEKKKTPAKQRIRREQEETVERWKRLCLSYLNDSQIGVQETSYKKRTNLNNF